MALRFVQARIQIGKPTCNCRKQGIFSCDHDRFYTDPTANWGYDSYRECYYFGHTFYQHVVSTQGHDLPIHVGIGPASETDFTLSLKSLDRFDKSLRENGLDWRIRYAVYDAGHDALGIYESLLDAEISPIIALPSVHWAPSANHPRRWDPSSTSRRMRIPGYILPFPENQNNSKS